MNGTFCLNSRYTPPLNHTSHFHKEDSRHGDSCDETHKRCRRGVSFFHTSSLDRTLPQFEEVFLSYGKFTQSRAKKFTKELYPTWG